MLSKPHFLYALRDIVIRSKPKYSAPTLLSIPVNSKMTLISFDESKLWAEIEYDGRNDLQSFESAKSAALITGWVPLD